MPAPCAPVGSLVRYPTRAYRCRGAHNPQHCPAGTPLTLVPMGDDDWQYAGPDGTTHVDTAPAAYRADPAAWWDRLAAVNIAAYSVARGAIVPFPPHIHEADRRHDDTETPRPPVPLCCGSPLRLVPAGWRCRVAGTLFAFTEED